MTFPPVAAERGTALRRYVPMVASLGGFLLVVSFAASWTASGVGASLSGRALADLLLRGVVGRFVPRWAGLGLYLLPVCGGLALIGTGIGGRTGRRIVSVATALSAVVFLLVAVALDWAPVTRPGPAPYLVVSGLVVSLVAMAGETRTSRVGPPAAAGPEEARPE